MFVFSRLIFERAWTPGKIVRGERQEAAGRGQRRGSERLDRWHCLGLARRAHQTQVASRDAAAEGPSGGRGGFGRFGRSRRCRSDSVQPSVLPLHTLVLGEFSVWVL